MNPEIDAKYVKKIDTSYKGFTDEQDTIGAGWLANTWAHHVETTHTLALTPARRKKCVDVQIVLAAAGI